MLKNNIINIQKTMNQKLELIRMELNNSSDKGENAEEILSDFIKNYLPPIYRIGRGEIIDSYGKQSSQIDIIITNQYHPFISDYNRPSIFFVEGVSCCGEVKMYLNDTHLNAALNNCKSLKNIIPKHLKSTQISSSPSDIKRFIDRKPYFIFTYNSSLSIETVKERIDIFNRNIKIEEQVDAIFLLDKGTIINFGDGRGQLKYGKPRMKETFPGFHITNKKTESILYDFLTWLSVSIQNMVIFNSILINYVEE